MTLANETRSPLQNADRFFIGGEWVQPSSDRRSTSSIRPPRSCTSSIAEAQAADMDRAIAAARTRLRRRTVAAADPRPARRVPARFRQGAGDPRRRARRHLAARVRRAGDASPARPAPAPPSAFDYYAGLADTFAFEEPAQPSSGGKFGLLVREPVGVVGAIIPWNAPLSLAIYKLAPAFLAGCTAILKASPEAPGAAYILAEVGGSDRPAAGRAERRHRRP